MTSVKISNLSVSYRNQKSNSKLEIDNLEIASGKIVGFFGPNHIGKSTLLKVIGQLHSDLKFSNGSQILYDGNQYDKEHNTPRLLHVPQDFSSSIFPWFSIGKNLRILMKSLNIDDEQIENNVSEFCRIFEFNNEQELFHHYGFSDNGTIKAVTSLSGGQKQIAMVIRTLIAFPNIITMDEPFSAIDFYRGKLFREKVLKFVEEKKITTFIVSHDLEDLLSFVDEIVFIKSNGNKSILQEIEKVGIPIAGSNLTDFEIEEYAKRLKIKYNIS